MKFVAKHGHHKTFHVGSNSSCRQHIWRHYAVYKEKCMALKIHENHHAIPCAFIHAVQEEKKQMKGGQKKLDIMFQGTRIPQEFSKDEVLRAVAEFVVCNYQVSEKYHVFQVDLLFI
ncbi:hypothetical protein BDR05DRAFT_884948 [Suillus weaverae]|nr:hypothetical protein BDR05DRAFT_884948 [Suillus weaverae]